MTWKKRVFFLLVEISFPALFGSYILTEDITGQDSHANDEHRLVKRLAAFCFPQQKVSAY